MYIPGDTAGHKALPTALIATLLLCTTAPAAYAQNGGNLVADIREELQQRSGDAIDQAATNQADAPSLQLPEALPVDPNVFNVTDAEAIRIGSILIESDSAIDQSLFAETIEPLLGTEVSTEDLARLTNEIARIARDNGMVFANAYVPEQAIELGIVRIALDMGGIDDVRIIGSDNEELREILAPLIGSMGEKDTIERRLLLANAIPKIQVRKTDFVQQNGQRILVVTVSERKGRHRASVDNYGTSAFGPVRARLQFEFAGLLDDSDLAQISFRTNPVDPQEVSSVNADYSLAVGQQGTRIGVTASFTNNEPGGRLAGSTLEGKSTFAAAYVRHPLVRSRDANLYVNAELAYLNIDQDIVNTLIRSDTVVTFSTGLSASVRTGGGWLRSGAEYRQGLGILGATRLGDPLGSRSDGDGVFSKGRFWVDWTSRIVGDVSVRVAVNGQIASRPLLSAEELGIGGAFSVRGFDFSERQGDQGVIGLIELRQDFRAVTPWLDRLQLYGFVDGGYVSNLRDGFGGGTLVSAGAGLRGDIGPFDFELEGAAPVNSERDASDDASPTVNVRVGVNF